MRWLRGFALALAWWSAGCSASPDAAASTCTLAKGQVVAHHPGLRFHGVKLLTVHGELAALWSDTEGLWWRRLDAQGAPLAAAVRLADPCAGGLDALASAGQLVVACSRPAEAGSEAGELAVYRVTDAAQVSAPLSLGPVGRDGRGVSMSSAGARVNVVFHEGSMGQHVVHWAVLEGATVKSDKVVSNPQHVAGSPSSFVDLGHHYALWSESDLSAQPAARTDLWLKADDEGPRRLAQTSVAEASPSLSREGDQLLLAFRDQQARDKRSEFYVTRLNRALTQVAKPVRVGRANGEGTPRLVRCSSVLAAVLPREYGGEHYVAVHDLDDQLTNRGGGHQYYANTREFVLASAACAGAEGDGDLTLLIGERAHPSRPGVELMTLRFSCRR